MYVVVFKYVIDVLFEYSRYVLNVLMVGEDEYWFDVMLISLNQSVSL